MNIFWGIMLVFCFGVLLCALMDFVVAVILKEKL